MERNGYLSAAAFASSGASAKRRAELLQLLISKEQRGERAAVLYNSGDVAGALSLLSALQKENRLSKQSVIVLAMARRQMNDRTEAEKLLAEAEESR